MISDSQWDTVEKTLRDSLYEQVKFRLPSGGAVITVYKAFVSENKTELVVWIDGQRNGAWGWSESVHFRPLVQQVWRRKTYKPGAKYIRQLSQTKAGRAALKKTENAYLHRVVEYWVCSFDTATSLVRQYRKIEGLELINEPELTNV